MSALCYYRTSAQQQIAASFNDLLGVLFFRGRNVVAGAGFCLCKPLAVSGLQHSHKNKPKMAA
jgi:hypothetical protein